jgi:hypothetical protein
MLLKGQSHAIKALFEDVKNEIYISCMCFDGFREILNGLLLGFYYKPSVLHAYIFLLFLVNIHLCSPHIWYKKKKDVEIILS